MDPVNLQQFLQTIKGINGTVRISDIIIGAALAGLVGEKIWIAVLKAKSIKLAAKNGTNGKNGRPTADSIADKVVEEQAIQTHYQATEKIADGVGRLCNGVDLQARTSVKILTVMEQVEKNTRGIRQRRRQ